jgi:hypothetical protein
MRWVEHVTHIGARKGVYSVLTDKSDVKRPFGRPRRRWKDIIKMDIQEVEFGVMDWIELAQHTDRWRALVNAVINLQVSYIAGNFLTSIKPANFSRRICSWSK